MAKMKACPVCGQNVSLDKLEMHVKKVHPREKVDIQLDEEEKKEVVEAKKAYKPSGAPGGKWIILVAAIVIVVVVIAFVVLPNTTLTGKDAPDFTLPDTAGVPWNLESHKRVGEPILLEFMHPDCGACKSVAPTVLALYDNYGSKLEFVTIAIKLEVEGYRNPPDASMVSTFKTQHGTPWTYLYEGGGSTTVRDRYEVTATPTFYLLDKQGKIVYTQVGTRDYATMRDAILPYL